MKLLIIFSLIFLSKSLFSQVIKKNFKWGDIDNPDDFLIGYETSFKNLPLEGKLKEEPWSGTYWATYQGGITYRWNKFKVKAVEKFKYDLLDSTSIKKMDQNELASLSPAEKFDILLGDYTFPFTRFERERTGVMKNEKIPTWFGLCHAWAPATLFYSSPKPISLKNPHGIEIPFGASDIKALLTYNVHLQEEGSSFLGGRCNASLPSLFKSYVRGTIAEDKFLNLINNLNCQDMNPGAMHLALANLIGLRKTGFVMDKTRGGEVWNQAVYSYKTVIKRKMKLKSFKETLGFKPIHPLLGPDKIISVETTVVYVNEIGPNWEGLNHPQNSLVPLTYKYYLYVNRYGDIVGGKWNPRNKARPDFFWRSSNPGFSKSMEALGFAEGESFRQLNQMRGKRKKRSSEELSQIFKKSIKKIILANRFIKNSKEINRERRKKRKNYYNRLKINLLKNYKDLKIRWWKLRGR
jgi:hypothetical protein